jgi:hypothetical protein
LLSQTVTFPSPFQRKLPFCEEEEEEEILSFGFDVCLRNKLNTISFEMGVMSLSVVPLWLGIFQSSCLLVLNSGNVSSPRY